MTEHGRSTLATAKRRTPKAAAEPVVPANPIDRIVPDHAVTLDRALRTNPSRLSDADLEDLIIGFRKERVTFTQKDEAKKSKKAGVEDIDLNATDDDGGTDE
jgi:hypothetical protein